MALNVATLALILCRQVKTIKHGSVRINIVHFPIPCFLNFCSAVPTTFFSFLMIFLLVVYNSMTTCKNVQLFILTRDLKITHPVRLRHFNDF